MYSMYVCTTYVHTYVCIHNYYIYDFICTYCMYISVLCSMCATHTSNVLFMSWMDITIVYICIQYTYIAVFMIRTSNCSDIHYFQETH